MKRPGALGLFYSSFLFGLVFAALPTFFLAPAFGLGAAGASGLWLMLALAFAAYMNRKT